uniref:Uncharacterized protein n=1 Tax=Plectus sambesii TaxID=2011161 RepID=A0A914WXW4_9BILA
MLFLPIGISGPDPTELALLAHGTGEMSAQGGILRACDRTEAASGLREEEDDKRRLKVRSGAHQRRISRPARTGADRKGATERPSEDATPPARLIRRLSSDSRSRCPPDTDAAPVNRSSSTTAAAVEAAAEAAAATDRHVRKTAIPSPTLGGSGSSGGGGGGDGDVVVDVHRTTWPIYRRSLAAPRVWCRGGIKLIILARDPGCHCLRRVVTRSAARPWSAVDGRSGGQSGDPSSTSRLYGIRYEQATTPSPVVDLGRHQTTVAGGSFGTARTRGWRARQ